MRAVLVLNLFSAQYFMRIFFKDSEPGFGLYLRHILLKFTVEWTDYWHLKLICFFLKYWYVLPVSYSMQWLYRYVVEFPDFDPGI